MQTTDIGQWAERAAADYLADDGYSIIELNWKKRECEIDIIARREGAIYFIEVKYRSTENEGSGLDYVTDKKIRRMRFAAETWVRDHGWWGEYQLAAVEVSGPSYEVSTFVEDIY